MVLIPVPIGRGYTAVVKGEIVKSETCERCGTKFVYLMKRSAKGQGTSPMWLNNAGAENRALRRADELLQLKLEKEIDLVPCPACGTYQKKMVARQRRRYMLMLAGFLVVYVIGMLVLFPWYREYSPATADARSGAVGRNLPIGPRFNKTAKTAFYVGLGPIGCAGLWLLLRNYNAKAASRAGKPARNVMLKWKYEQEKLRGVAVEESMGGTPGPVKW